MMNRRNLFRIASVVAIAAVPSLGAHAASAEWLSVDEVVDRLYGLHTSVKLVTHEELLGGQPGLEDDKGIWHLFRVTDAETLGKAFHGSLASYAAWQPEGQHGVVLLSDLKADMLRGYDNFTGSKRHREEAKKYTALISSGASARDIPIPPSGTVHVHGFFAGYDRLSTKPREGMSV